MVINRTFTCEIAMKKILIIGNSEPSANHKYLLEDAEIVVRFNNKQYKFASENKKTTLLSIVNTGAVGHALLQNIKSNKFYLEARTILFARSQKVHQDHLLQNPLRDKYSEDEVVDVSHEYEEGIVRDGKLVEHLSDTQNLECFRLIQSRTHLPFICLSSGFLVVWSFLNNPQYAAYEKHIVGFSFKGWWGHPWATEKEIMLELHRENKLIFHDCTLMDKLHYKIYRLRQKMFH